MNFKRTRSFSPRSTVEHSSITHRPFDHGRPVPNAPSSRFRTRIHACFSIKGARRDARENQKQREREREFQFLQRERLSEICYSIVEDRPVIRHCYDMIYNIRDTLFGELWKCMVYDSCISSFLRIIIIYEYRR